MLLALLCSLSAHAYDLDLGVSVHGGDPTPVVLSDVRPGVLRGVVLPGVEGHDHRVLVQLSEGDADHAGAVIVSFTLEEVNVEGRRVAVESRPRMTLVAEEPAQLGIGVVPDGAGGMRAQGAELTLVVHAEKAAVIDGAG